MILLLDLDLEGLVYHCMLYGASGGASGSGFLAQGYGISFAYSAPSSIADKDNPKPFEISLRKRKAGDSSSNGPRAKKTH